VRQTRHTLAEDAKTLRHGGEMGPRRRRRWSAAPYGDGGRGGGRWGGASEGGFFKGSPSPLGSEQEELVEEDVLPTFQNVSFFRKLISYLKIFIFQNGGKSKRKIISCLQFFIYSHGGLVSKFKPQG
jgi:hypothetical protein